MKRFMYTAACVSLVLMFVFFFLMVNTLKSVFCTLGITAMTICYHFTVRLVIGNIADRIKLSRFKPESRRFRERKFERKLYKAIRVKKWKKFAPTYDKKLFSLKDRSVDNIIGETCCAEVVHSLCALASLASICFTVWFGSLPAFLITGILGALVDLTFVIIQRYNRPRLKRLEEKIDNVQLTIDN